MKTEKNQMVAALAAEIRRVTPAGGCSSKTLAALLQPWLDEQMKGAAPPGAATAKAQASVPSDAIFQSVAETVQAQCAAWEGIGAADVKDVWVRTAAALDAQPREST